MIPFGIIKEVAVAIFSVKKCKGISAKICMYFKTLALGILLVGALAVANFFAVKSLNSKMDRFMIEQHQFNKDLRDFLIRR